jgi:hypothetical protein
VSAACAAPMTPVNDSAAHICTKYLRDSFIACSFCFTGKSGLCIFHVPAIVGMAWRSCDQ